MSYEAFNRKGTPNERRARLAQLKEELEQKIIDAGLASAEAEKLNTVQAHLLAASAWRRIIYPATRLNQDATIYRDGVRVHTEAAKSLSSGHSAQ